jgi:hypothetical protein
MANFRNDGAGFDRALRLHPESACWLAHQELRFAPPRRPRSSKPKASDPRPPAFRPCHPILKEIDSWPSVKKPQQDDPPAHPRA